ncbi:hypothetical protein Pcinc_038407 [Petrolisthes cinctipes]|uniref:Uncharacterized protein n=1 Tax=Petrolisthes cinctipes TaxID=88211 RepID=A0AAE1BR21_PETCI|nr:hypothetical protein Pcinc_038407 [Petrolisthes cinctipes]
MAALEGKTGIETKEGKESGKRRKEEDGERREGKVGEELDSVGEKGGTEERDGERKKEEVEWGVAGRGHQAGWVGEEWGGAERPAKQGSRVRMERGKVSSEPRSPPTTPLPDATPSLTVLAGAGRKSQCT